MSLDIRLRAIAAGLGMPTQVEGDARERGEVYRLQHLKPRDFEAAYARLVTRGCDNLLERMDRMDPMVNSRLLFFVDDTMPRLLQLARVLTIATLNGPIGRRKAALALDLLDIKRNRFQLRAQ